MSVLVAVSDERIAVWRRDTPGCAERVHLNNAGSAFSPRPVFEAQRAHLSPHYYNTREEIDTLVTAIAELLQETHR